MIRTTISARLTLVIHAHVTPSTWEAVHPTVMMVLAASILEKGDSARCDATHFSQMNVETPKDGAHPQRMKMIFMAGDIQKMIFMAGKACASGMQIQRDSVVYSVLLTMIVLLV
jgi:hypothetical protein